MKKKLLLLLAIVLILSACQPDPLTVGTNYLNAVKNDDVEAMLAEVSDDVVLVISGDPLFHTETNGKEEMRAYMQENSASGMVMELTGEPVVNGNQITIPNRLSIADFKALGVEWISGEDVITVEKGKVIHDIWTLDDSSRDELFATFAELQRQFEEGLVGTWRAFGDDETYKTDFHYHADGTYEMIRYIVGEETLWDKGTYSCEGNVVTLITTEAKYCKMDAEGVYEILLTENGEMQTSLINDACGKRSPPVNGPINSVRITE